MNAAIGALETNLKQSEQEALRLAEETEMRMKQEVEELKRQAAESDEEAAPVYGTTPKAERTIQTDADLQHVIDQHPSTMVAQNDALYSPKPFQSIQTADRPQQQRRSMER